VTLLLLGSATMAEEDATAPKGYVGSSLGMVYTGMGAVKLLVMFGHSVEQVVGEQELVSLMESRSCSLLVETVDEACCGAVADQIMEPKVSR
jgi:hypothetical protein